MQRYFNTGFEIKTEMQSDNRFITIDHTEKPLDNIYQFYQTVNYLMIAK